MTRSSQPNRLRIIGGQWRSRILDFPSVAGLRPTPDRVRETLFNWLGQDLSGRRCIDLFAGSGALGFEALSRNAAHVTMVEEAPAVVRVLTRNADKLEAGDRLRLLRADALHFLDADEATYDVAFVDPPYARDLIDRIWPLLDRRLASGASIYAEDDRPLTAPRGWRIAKSSRAGGVYFYLMERTSDE
jgi:16S rRNA (guanine966-N2)-methyltransferase